MKKQVLSFNEYILESYSLVLEAKDLDEIQNIMDLDDQGKNALAMVKDVIMMNSEKKGEELMRRVAEKFEQTIKALTKKGSYKVETTVNPIEIDTVVQNKVFVANSDIPAIQGFTIKGNVKFADLLGYLNYQNGTIGRGSRNIPVLTGDGKFEEDDKYVKNSGISNQYNLEFEGKSININSSSAREGKYGKGTDKINSIAKNFTEYKDAKKSKKANYTILFYVIKDILPGKGNEIDIKKLIKDEIPAEPGTQTLDLIIPDDGTLFEVNKDILKDTGKDNIRAALGPFTSIESIEVTGGASQEGTEKRNKELCKLRAEAVKKFLSEITKAEIKVSDKADIQPKEDKSDRKTWRRVKLKIKGKTTIPVEKKEIVYSTEKGKINADKYILAQVAMRIEFTLDKK